MPNAHSPDAIVLPVYRLTDGKKWRIVMLLLWVGVPIGIVYVLTMLLPDARLQATGAVRFVDVLEALPTLWWLYALVLSLVSVWIFRYRQIRADLRSEFLGKQQDADRHDLSERDWWVAEGLRKRALDLRLRADLILGGVLVLLFAGVYLVIFVLKQISAIDMDLAERRQREMATLRQELAFKDKFGEEFDAMVAGRYWLKSNFDIDRIETFLEPAYRSRNQLAQGHEGFVFTITDGGRQFSLRKLEFKRGERSAVLTFSADGQTGLVGGDEGSVFMTTDGGSTWNPIALKLPEREQVDAAAFSADGQTGLVGGDEGSVFMTTDGGSTWNPPEFNLARGEQVVVVTLSADGQTGLVAGVGGSVSVNLGNGQNWKRISGQLKYGERPMATAFSADGQTGLVGGDEGSVFITTDGGENWIQNIFDLKRRERVSSVAWTADGTAGLVAGDSGSVWLTQDGGQNWIFTSGLNELQRRNCSPDLGSRMTNS